MSDTEQMTSRWPALHNPIFRMLWIASLVSNIGTWMHEVGAAWLMTSLTTNPLWVAAVQATTAFSICALALPAGALADIIDRRRYLIFLQSGMLITAATLACLTYLGTMTPELLLLLTFLLGGGAALSMPTWQAMIPEIVRSKDLFSAILLNGVSFNISRAVGPALAGIIIASLGVGAVFAINAISFFGILFALKVWQRQPSDSTLPAERFFSAIRSGLRYVKGSPSLHRVMLKSCAFFLFASAPWALLPVVARTVLKSGPIGYGLLMACLGVGAVVGAFSLTRLRQLLNIDKIVFAGALGFTITCLLLGWSSNFYIACGAMLLAGLCWVSVIASLNTVAQFSVSSWVRARALSVYLMIFFGSMTAGSMIWGLVAKNYNVTLALTLPAVGLIIGNLITYRFRLEGVQLLDHTPTHDSPSPKGELTPEHEQGPVMVEVEYWVKKENHDAFINAIQAMRRIRLREGAYFWGLFHDVEKHQRFVEYFMVESWLEHLRYHERVSVSDRKCQAKVSAFHEGERRPKVTHLIAENNPKR